MHGRKALAALTIFVGSFLAFGVQPMVGNTLLPVFGGTAAVWTVCLAAFQVMLIGGYWWGHFLGGGDGLNHVGCSVMKLRVHLTLLFAAACWVAVVALNRETVIGWLGDGGAPALRALLAVLILAGVPYVLLSANASLVQMLAGGEYRLYSVSNAGSLCGLLAYPLAVEPMMTVAWQWLAFSMGVALYAAMLLGSARLWKRAGEHVAKGSDGGMAGCEPAPRSIQISAHIPQLEWLGLSAASCFMLNGVSAHLTNDVTPLPLMWAVLLALYLASYIVAFTDRGARWSRWLGAPVAALCAAGAYYAGIETGESFAAQLTIGCALIFFGGWMVHGRLYRVRPEAQGLTRFNLALAAGGAIGGSAASIAVPLLFPFVAEYPAVLGILPAVALLDAAEPLRNRLGLRIGWRWYAAVCAIVAAYGCIRTAGAAGEVLERRRNFYGVSRVVLDWFRSADGDGFQAHIFQNNATVHGYQVVNGGMKSRIPTTYYTDHTGGLAILAHPAYATHRPMRVALAGMGVGVLASYSRAGDTYRFYEINPQVAELATDTNLFTFVSGAIGKVEIVVDDARRALERERAADEQRYDVLIVDVFSGDSIPAHMATREAVALYLERLKPDGILAFHISNWHLNLSPFVKAAAKEFDLYLEDLQCINDRYTFIAHWAFLSRCKMSFAIPGKHGIVRPEDVADIPLMTDGCHSLLPYLGQQKEVPLIPAPKEKRSTLF